MGDMSDDGERIQHIAPPTMSFTLRRSMPLFVKYIPDFFGRNSGIPPEEQYYIVTLK